MQDIVANGITPNNTAIQSEDYYKNIDQVRAKFTDENGNFDEVKYDNFYRSALSTYNDYANGTFEKEMIQNMAKDPFDWTDPLNTNRKNYSARVQVGYNPDRRSMGVGNLFEVGGPSFSMREVAQANIARDEEGNLLNWTPNEKGGLFKALTRPTLALATWDEDGTHEINGVSVVHKKGEYKFDENGDPYYEKLGNREGFDKDILRWTDTITVDGSKLNSIDFMDSDGLTKSAFGTIAKATALMAPLLLPGVGEVYGTVKALFDLAGVLPTLGKAVNGILTGNNKNGIGTALTQMENYMSRFDSTTSDYSRDNFFSFENIGNIFSESAGQLFSQRQIWNLAKAMNLGGTAVRTAQVGQTLSLGYMALTSSKEAYSEFKRAGADDKTAGIGMLAITAAMFGLMRQDYFRDFMFQDTYMTDSESREAVKAFEKLTRDELVPELVTKQAVDKAKAALDQKGLAGFYVSMKDAATNVLKKVFGKPEVQSIARQMWFGSINEATEEVMEEVSTDAVKGLFAGLNALGIPMSEEKNKELDFGITPSDMLQRYAASFFGGFLGGATFQGYELYENRNIPRIDWEHMNDGVRKHIAYLISTGHGQELADIVRLRGERGKMGNINLSAKIENGSWVNNPNGTGRKFVWAHGTDSDNQNLAVYNRISEDIIQYRRMIEDAGVLFNDETFNPLAKTGDLLKQTAEFAKKAESMGISPEELMAQLGTNPIINFIFESGLGTSTITDDIVDLNSRIVEAGLKLQSLESSENEEDKTALKKAKENLKKLSDERDQLIEGKKNYQYAEQILFTVHPRLHSLLFNKSESEDKPFAASNVQNYVKVNYDLTWNDLSDDEKKAYQEEYSDYMQKEGADKIKKGFKLFSKFNQQIAPVLVQMDSVYKDASANSYYADEGTFVRKSNINLWEQKKQELATYQTEIENVKKQIAERIAELGADSSELESDEKLLELTDLQNELTAEAENTLEEVKSIESNISAFLESTPTQLGLDQYVDTVLAKINNPDVTINDLYSAFDDVANYYTKLKDSGILSDNDVVLNSVLAKLSEAFNGDTKIDIRTADQVNSLLDRVLNFLEKEGKNESELDTVQSIIGSAFSGDNIQSVKNAIKNYYTELGSGKIDKLNGARGLIADALNVLLTKLSKDPLIKLYIDNNQEEFNNWVSNLPELLVFGALDSNNTPDTRFTDAISNLAAIKSQVITMPVLDLLKGFNINLDDQLINTIQLLEEERLNLLLSKTPNEYMISDPFKVQALKQLLDLLNLLEAAVEVANDGYNNAINQFRPTDVDPTAEISDNTAMIIAEDISFLRKKVKALLNLSEANTADKVKIQKDIEINCYPKYLTTLFEGGELPDDTPEDVLNKTFMYRLGSLLGLEGKTIKDIWNETLVEVGAADLDYTKITESNYELFRKAIHTFESKLRAIALEHTEINEDFGKQLAEISGDDVWQMRQNLMSRDEDYSVTSYQRLMYLASVFADDVNSFYQKYERVVSDSEYCPFFNQEMAVRQAWGLISNNNLYKGIVSKMMEQVKEVAGDDLYLQNMKAAINTIFVDGGTGTGKSTAVAQTLVKMLGHDRVIVVAPTELLLDPEKGSVGKLTTDPNKRLLLDSILESMYGENVLDELDRVETEQHGNQFDQDILDSKAKDISSLYGTDVKPEDSKVMIIDEGSLIDEGHVQALITSAIKNNISIIFLGDIKQNSELKDGTPNGYFDFIGLQTVTLSETVRADNKCKVDNYRSINSLLNQVVDFIKSDTKNNDPVEASKHLMNIINERGKARLSYYYKPDIAFAGERVVKESSLAKGMLDEILNYEGDKTVAIITDETTDAWWAGQTLPQNVKRISYKQVQGGEFDYVIIDHDFSKSNDSKSYLMLRDLYTLVNRSKKGSVIVDPNSSLDALVDNVPDQNGNRDISFNDNIINAFKEWKAHLFEAMQITKPDTQDPDVKVEDFEGTDLESDDFKDLGVKGSDVITGGALKPLSDSEKEEIRKTDKTVSTRQTFVEKANSIDYDEFGDWCDESLITYEKGNPFSFYQNFFSEDKKPTDKAWTYFVKVISSIIIDDIHNLENTNFNDSKLNSLYLEFAQAWDNEETHTYYLSKISEHKGVLSYKFKDMLIPVAIVNMDRENAHTKYVVDSKTSPFSREYGMGFFAKGTRNYIVDSCKHLYWDSTFGIFSLEKGKPSMIPDQYHKMSGKVDKTKGFEEETRGKTEAMITHNLYYSIHSIGDSFKFDQDEDGLNMHYTRGNRKNNTKYDMCALRTVQHSVSLQELIAICDVMQYALGNNRKNKLHGISSSLGIRNREEALAWVASRLGPMEELRLVTTSDEAQRKEIIKKNFANLSSKYEVISKETAKSLISNIYNIFKNNPDFDEYQFVERLFNYLNYVPELDRNRLLQYGYQFTVRREVDGKFEYDNFYIELNDDKSKYNLYEFDFKNNKPYKEPFDTIDLEGISDKIPEIFEKINKHLGEGKSLDVDLSEAIESGDFKFTLMKHIINTSNSGSENSYYQMNAYDLIFKLLNIKDLDVTKLGEALLKTKAFSNGIYVRDASSRYFDNDDTKSAFKQFYPEGDLINQYSSDFGIGLAPVYQLTSTGINIDSNPESDFDKALISNSKMGGEEDLSNTINITSTSGSIVTFSNGIFKDLEGNTLDPLGTEGNYLVLTSNDTFIRIPYEALSEVSSLKEILEKKIVGFTTSQVPIFNNQAGLYSVGKTVFKLSDISNLKEENGILKLKVKGVIVSVPNSYDFANKARSMFGTKINPIIKIEPGTVATKQENVFTFSKPISVNSDWVRQFAPEFSSEAEFLSITGLDFNKNLIIFADNKPVEVAGMNGLGYNSFGQLGTLLSNTMTSNINELKNSLESLIMSPASEFDMDLLADNLDSITRGLTEIEDILKAINDFLDENNEPYSIVYDEVSKEFLVQKKSNDKTDALSIIVDTFRWNWADDYDNIEDIPFEDITSDDDASQERKRYLVNNTFLVLKGNGLLRAFRSDARTKLNDFIPVDPKNEMEDVFKKWINAELTRDSASPIFRDQARAIDAVKFKEIARLLRDWKVFITQNPVNPGC